MMSCCVGLRGPLVQQTGLHGRSQRGVHPAVCPVHGFGSSGVDLQPDPGAVVPAARPCHGSGALAGLAAYPGPALAFFDQLIESDLSFAAGGLLRDIAERLGDADEHLAGTERETFRRASLEVISHGLGNDAQAIASLLAETE